jgi:hypothetical protein
VLTLLHHTTSTLNPHHRIEALFVLVFYLYSALYTTMPTIQHPDPALSIGFEIISLPDQAVQISSFTNVAQQQQSMSHMPRANVETLQQERNGESSKFLLRAAYPLPIALSHSNPVAQLKPGHLRNPMLQSPPPPHLPLLLIRLRTPILMQRSNTLVAGLVSGSLSVALLLSIPTVIINICDNLSRPMMLSDPLTIYNEGMSSFIARFIYKYRVTRIAFVEPTVSPSYIDLTYF